MLARRGIIGAFAGLIAVPAIVRVDSLMALPVPVRKVPAPESPIEIIVYDKASGLTIRVEKITVTAKQRTLSARWTLETIEKPIIVDHSGL